MFYNYHAVAKRLLNTNHCIAVSVFKCYHHIYPALVLYFDNHAPIPIRQYRWQEYLPILKQLNMPINNPDSLSLDELR